MDNEEWGMENSMLLRLSWINCYHCQTKQGWDLMQDLLPTSNGGNLICKLFTLKPI